MNLSTAGRMQAILVAATLLLPIAYVKAEPPGAQRFSVEKLSAACRAAKADFRPLAEADLKQATEQLRGAVRRLDARLAADPKNGPRWREYLQWESLQEQLKRDQDPDLDVLNEIAKKYRAGHEGLKLHSFADVQDTLARYRLIARAIDNPKTQAVFQGILEGLPAYLEAYQAQPTTELALQIGAALDWLEDHRQVPGLLAELRAELGGPNLLLQVSGELLGAAIGGPVDDTAPVRDVILGTDIFGTGHTTGQVRLELVPDDRRGAFETVFSGTTRTQTVGYKGPVRIYSTGSTHITGRKRFWIDAGGLAARPTVSSARTRNKVNHISSKRDSRFVERFAWRKSEKKQHEAQRIASRHAERQFNRRMDREAGGMIDRANKAYRTKIRGPLASRNLFPQGLDFCSSESLLQVVGLLANRSQLGAPTDPPEPAEDCDLAVRVHESTVNNLAAAALGGMLLREERVLAALKRLEVSQDVLDRAKSMEGEPPWKIAFDPIRPGSGRVSLPVSVRFADGRFAVTIRGGRFYRGDNAYPATHMTAEYQFEQSEDGFKATRQGDLRVTRPDGGYTANRAVFQRRFDGLFRDEIELGQVELEVGKDGEDGGPVKKRTIRIKPVQCVCRDGWLVIAWKRIR